MAVNKSIEFWKLGRKIACVALNYKGLLKERNLSIPKEPVIFLKPTSSYITMGETIQIPIGFEVNEEVELGVIISKKCKNVDPSQAFNYIAGYCLALDLTAVNILRDAKEKGGPWSIGKGFDTACPVGEFIPCGEIPDPSNIRIWCQVNGKVYQDSCTSDMVFSVNGLLSYISKYITLEPFDLILTGSPRGSKIIASGDVIEGGIGNNTCFKFFVK
uniref:oxaloacetate tautomerase n=2 Tax=Clastoptera arizonana TaxID=38151 RepID=A0A1B6DPG1_9HEMI